MGCMDEISRNFNIVFTNITITIINLSGVFVMKVLGVYSPFTGHIGYTAFILGGTVFVVGEVLLWFLIYQIYKRLV